MRRACRPGVTAENREGVVPGRIYLTHSEVSMGGRLAEEQVHINIRRESGTPSQRVVTAHPAMLAPAIFAYVA